MTLHSVRFPGESDAYRVARNELLEAELALRRQAESVAALRRKLPPGGHITQDYVFRELPRGSTEARPVQMSELFAERKNTLIVYSFMYGPEMKQACPSCTAILDGLDGQATHVWQMTNFVVVAKNPIDMIMQHAANRGWRNLQLLSSEGSTYNHDYQGENATGNQMPAMNVFVRTDNGIRHSWCSELLFAPKDPGQDFRHVDTVWPLWSLLDVTPEGRGGFYPRLSY